MGTVLVFDTDPGVDPRKGLDAIRGEPSDGDVVVGIGEPLALALGSQVDSLRGFPALSGVGVAFPSSQGALWLFVRGEERGSVLNRAMALHKKLGSGWRLLEEVDAFRYRGGRDLRRFHDLEEGARDAIFGRRASERLLRRMAGLDDGQVDGLLAITRAISGGYYFCPPMMKGGLDLRAVGL